MLSGSWNSQMKDKSILANWCSQTCLPTEMPECLSIEVERWRKIPIGEYHWNILRSSLTILETVSILAYLSSGELPYQTFSDSWDYLRVYIQGGRVVQIPFQVAPLFSRGVFVLCTSLNFSDLPIRKLTGAQACTESPIILWDVHCFEALVFS